MEQPKSAGAIFKEAREMYLPDVAEALGYKFKRGQNKFFSNTCPSCGEGRSGGNGTSIFCDEQGLWRWNCFCCGKGGTSIDFVAHAKGLVDIEAAKYLVVGKFAPVVAPLHAKIVAAAALETAVALQQVIKILIQKGLSSEHVVRDYLKGRGLDERVQMEAVRRGQLRMLPSSPHAAFSWLVENVGEGLLRKSGLWKAGSKWPAIAFRPLISIFPHGTSAEFRLARDVADQDETKAIRYGAMKWPWWWKSDAVKQPDSIIVVEGVIDLWSLVQMGVDKTNHLMAIPGTGTWNAAWMKQAAEKNGCKHGLVGIDNDGAGDLVANTMIKEIRESGLGSFRLLPEKKDWNLDLRGGRTTF